MIETSRRSLIIGLTGLICAPAIVRASSLMKVKGLDPAAPFETAFPVNLGTLSGWTALRDVEGRIITHYGLVLMERGDDSPCRVEWKDPAWAATPETHPSAT